MGIFKKNKVSAGEAERLAAYYIEKYGNAMLRFAYSYLQNTEDAEDVVQDALIRAIDSEAAFENEKHERTYLLQIVKNLCFDHIGKRGKAAESELDENIEAKESEDYSFVRDAVGMLPKNEREAIHLFYIEGYSTKEIAKILGRKESTVRSDMLRGRAHLKDILKEEFDFE
jgi:RNA polymerase sigma-70 factor (ECF subfamily)